MPPSPILAARIRKHLKSVSDLSEKSMFGGICFLVKGNMALGLINDDLMIRVGPDKYDEYLFQPHARKMDFTGKPLKGFLYVGKAGTAVEKDLKTWVRRGVEYARSLPVKGKK